MNRLAFILASLLAAQASAQTCDRYDREYVASLGMSGGTLTGALCWLDSGSGQSVCIATSGAGIMDIYGSGGTDDERLLWDYETVANEVGVSTTTGVTEIDFASIGLEATYFESETANPSSAGALRLANTECIGARNAGNTDDELLCVDASDDLTWSDSFVATGTVTGGTITDGTFTCTAGTCTGGVSITSTTLTDGAATMTAGALSGVTTVGLSGPMTMSDAAGGVVYLDDSTTTGDAAGTGNIYFRANDDATNQHTMARIEMDVTDATSGSEAADQVFYVTTPASGASTEIVRLDGSASLVDVTGALTASGNISTSSNLVATGFIRAGGAQPMLWDGRSRMTAPANGKWQLDLATPAAADSVLLDWVTVADTVVVSQSDASAITLDVTGTVEGDTVTDGTLTCTTGTCTGGVAITSAALTSSSALTASGSVTLGAPVNPGDADYTTLASSQWIAYQTACTVDRTVTLDDDHCVHGRWITVSDAGCLAGAANNLYINPEGGSTINGAVSLALTTNYESVDAFCLDNSGGAGAMKWVVR